MGYDITQTGSRFCIKGGHKTGKGLKTVLERLVCVNTEYLGRWTNLWLWQTVCKMYYALAWTSTPSVGYPDERPMDDHLVVEHLISDLFRAARWDVGFGADENGNHTINYIEFAGYKAGGEQRVLSAIQDLVEPGSYIEFRGEDGVEWRWIWEAREGHTFMYREDRVNGGEWVKQPQPQPSAQGWSGSW
jgi:hypothetical protein